MQQITIIIFYVCVASSIAGRPDPDAIRFPDIESQEHNGNINSRINIHHHHHDHMHRKDDTEKSLMLDKNNKEIPLDLIQKLNGVDDLSELFKNFLEGEEKLVGEFAVASRFGSVERAAAVYPKPAICKPTLQTVELKDSNDTSLFYFPSCTRIEKCGGCCLHSLLSCQAIETETISFQVVVSQYNGGSRLNVKGKEIIPIEKHTKCKCTCIVKKENCNSFQEYRQEECRCMCTNLDEKKKCEKKSDTKLWDPVVCKCQCREILDCSSGLYFDSNKCQCLPIPVRRRFAELHSNERSFSDRENYNVDSLTVSPLTSSEASEKKDKC